MCVSSLIHTDKRQSDRSPSTHFPPPLSLSSPHSERLLQLPSLLVCLKPLSSQSISHHPFPLSSHLLSCSTFSLILSDFGCLMCLWVHGTPLKACHFFGPFLFSLFWIKERKRKRIQRAHSDNERERRVI